MSAIEIEYEIQWQSNRFYFFLRKQFYQKEFRVSKNRHHFSFFLVCQIIFCHHICWISLCPSDWIFPTWITLINVRQAICTIPTIDTTTIIVTILGQIDITIWDLIFWIIFQEFEVFLLFFWSFYLREFYLVRSTGRPSFELESDIVQGRQPVAIWGRGVTSLRWGVETM